MSTPTPPPTPPPYGGPPAYGPPPWGPPPGPPPRPLPSRRRPSAWWFAVGALLVLVGMAVGGYLFFRTISAITETDVTVPADGRPHDVTVPTDGDRMLWVDRTATSPPCDIVDRGSGRPVTPRDPFGDFTRDTGDTGEQTGAWVFDPGSGELQVTCFPELADEVAIGPAPRFGEIFGSLAVAILVPLGLGLAGLVVLVVVAVLYATGQPRHLPAP